MGVTLRPLRRDDFGTLGEWLREPLVHEWWHEDAGAEALERRYGNAIDGTEPTELRIGEITGRPVGFVQWYRFADEPEYTAELAPFVAIPDDTWSIDYLVGSRKDRGRGVGAALIAAALAAMGPVPVVVPVHADNTASVGALLRNGFQVVAGARLEPDNPAHTREHLVLARP